MGAGGAVCFWTEFYLIGYIPYEKHIFPLQVQVAVPVYYDRRGVYRDTHFNEIQL